MRMIFPPGDRFVPIEVSTRDKKARKERRDWHAWLTGEDPLPIEYAEIASDFSLQAGLLNPETAEQNKRYFALIRRVVHELRTVKTLLRKHWDTLLHEGHAICLTQPDQNLFPDTLKQPTESRFMQWDFGWMFSPEGIYRGIGAHHPFEPWENARPNWVLVRWDGKPSWVTIMVTPYPLDMDEEVADDGSELAVRLAFHPMREADVMGIPDGAVATTFPQPQADPSSEELSCANVS